MKRTIIIGLALYSLFVVAGGAFVYTTVHRASRKLNSLILLHQVEILREHFLIQLRKVQSDLTLNDSPRAPAFDVVVSHVVKMRRVVDTCFDCHHDEPTTARIGELRDQANLYEESLSRVLTIHANRERRAMEQDVAYRLGEDLIAQVSDMIAVTTVRLEVETQRTLSEIEETKYALYGLLVLGPLVSLILGFVLVSRFTRPLRVLQESTRRLKAGDLDHRVTGLKAEFGELATAFNEMSASLTDQMHKMQRTEQMAVVGQLAAGLAHEIKNPLAGVKVAMEILDGESSLSEEDRVVVRKVREEVGRLEVLMRSFLNFAKPPRPQLAEIDLRALLDSTLALYTQGRAATRTGIQVRVEVPALPVTLADPMQLQQVFLNLLINGYEAMPEGGTLTVRAEHDEAARVIRVAVVDTGKGIDAGSLEKIFQPFFTTKPKGTGLGLAISRQLVEQMNGSLTASSHDAGGSVFTIEIPVLRAGHESQA